MRDLREEVGTKACILGKIVKSRMKWAAGLDIVLVLRMPPLFLLGIGKTRKATLIRTYFSLYIGLMYKSVQLHA